MDQMGTENLERYVTENGGKVVDKNEKINYFISNKACFKLLFVILK